MGVKNVSTYKKKKSVYIYLVFFLFFFGIFGFVFGQT